MMEMIYFTAVGIVVYLVADAILDRIERSMGRRLPYRSVIFFAIILTVTLGAFRLIRYALGS